MPINEELEFIDNLQLTEKEKMIGSLVIKEIKERLNFLNSVGLDYLSLSRESATLSICERVSSTTPTMMRSDVPPKN